MRVLRALVWAFALTAAAAGAARAEALSLLTPPVSVETLGVVGMAPTEVVEWTLLPQRSEGGSPLAVVFAKQTTTVGETLLDEVLATKHSIGVYSYHAQLHRWLPVWERVTGQMGIDFVEGYDILDVNGDGSKDVCVKIRYYGEGRALDYLVLAVNGGGVSEVFEQKSIYRGSVTASTGYIVVKRRIRDQGVGAMDVYAWAGKSGSFQKVREIRDRRDE